MRIVQRAYNIRGLQSDVKQQGSLHKQLTRVEVDAKVNAPISNHSKRHRIIGSLRETEQNYFSILQRFTSTFVVDKKIQIALVKQVGFFKSS